MISKTAVLTTQLLRQVQTWLRSGWPAWRVEIPTDGTLENVILVYPRKIRMNPAAESIENLAGYLRRMRIEMERIDSEQMERVH